MQFFLKLVELQAYAAVRAAALTKALILRLPVDSSYGDEWCLLRTCFEGHLTSIFDLLLIVHHCNIKSVSSVMTASLLALLQSAHLLWASPNGDMRLCVYLLTLTYTHKHLIHTLLFGIAVSFSSMLPAAYSFSTLDRKNSIIRLAIMWIWLGWCLEANNLIMFWIEEPLLNRKSWVCGSTSWGFSHTECKR